MTWAKSLWRKDAPSGSRTHTLLIKRESPATQHAAVQGTAHRKLPEPSPKVPQKVPTDSTLPTGNIGGGVA